MQERGRSSTFYCRVSSCRLPSPGEELAQSARKITDAKFRCDVAELLPSERQTIAEVYLALAWLLMMQVMSKLFGFILSAGGSVMLCHNRQAREAAFANSAGTFPGGTGSESGWLLTSAVAVAWGVAIALRRRI